MSFQAKQIQPIFLIGAMKSGTTTLSEYLKLHPEICFPPEKEPDFFAFKMSKSKYKNGSFFDLYNITTNHNFLFDGSTNYTKYPVESGVPERIYEYDLRPKFIYIVRNPFQRIESHYNFMQKNTNWHAKMTSIHLIKVSNYYLQLSEYLNFFSKEDFLIIDFDKLKHDYKSELLKVYEFVGLSKNYFPDKEVVANQTNLVNRSEIKLKNRVREYMKWLPAPLLEECKVIIGKFFRKKVRKLNSSEKKYIKKVLYEDMKKFSNEFGFDVSKWGFN